MVTRAESTSPSHPADLRTSTVRSAAVCRKTSPLLAETLGARGVEVREVDPIGAVGTATLPLNEPSIRAWHRRHGGQLNLLPSFGPGLEHLRPHAVCVEGEAGETFRATIDVSNKAVTVLATPKKSPGMYTAGIARFGADLAVRLGARSAQPVIVSTRDDGVMRRVYEADGVPVVLL